MRHLLVIALCADDAGGSSALAGEGAAVEDPLHQALREAEHGKRQVHALRVLQVADVDRLVGIRVLQTSEGREI